MNRLLLLAGALLTAGSAFAEWGNSIDSPVAVFPTGTLSYATETKAAPDGSVWTVVYHPNLREAADEYDTGNVVYEYRVQHFDPSGNPTFPEEGLLVSDYKNLSYTVVNDYLLVDRDGNAVIAVADCRNSTGSERSYTAYKISSDGEFLWGEDGVALSDPLKPSAFAGCVNSVQLEDGSYVFAWSEYDSNDVSHVCMQRLSDSGKAQWALDKAAITDAVSGYPYLVNSGDNTFILVYARTASSVLYARKLDFECESVWGTDVRIYRGGWGSVPLHTILSVKSSGDGGVLVAWSDDRKGENRESAYISYVTSDGALGFAGSSDEADVKLCYDEWRCFNVNAVPAADGSCFYAVWRRTDAAQYFQGVKIQKISRRGELLWGDDAKDLWEAEDQSLGYFSLQQAGADGACAFFEKYTEYFDQQCFAYRFDSNGDAVWPGGAVAVSEKGRQAASLASQPYTAGTWLCTWTDVGTSADDKATTYYMTCLDEEGTFGVYAAIEQVSCGKHALVCDGSTLRASVADGTVACIYTPLGARVAECVFAGGVASFNLPTGVYIAAAEGCEAPVKFIVKH